MPEQKEVEDVQKEFMDLLMEVKISVSELNVKFDNITDMKNTLDNTKEVAQEANRRSKQNADDIGELESDVKTKADKKEVKQDLEKKAKDIEKKADKSEVERIVKEKDNWKRNLPAWVAVAISAIAILLPYITQ